MSLSGRMASEACDDHCDQSTCFTCDSKYEINNGLPKCKCGCAGMSY